MTDSRNLTVRRAGRADAPTLVAFNRAMALETESLDLAEETVGAGVAAVLRDPAKGFYLVAEAHGQVCGALLVTREWSDWRNGIMWWIQSVYVRREARGSGVYRALHARVVSLGRRHGGVRGIRLYVEKSNRRAQNAYTSLGMTRSDYLMFEQVLTP